MSQRNFQILPPLDFLAEFTQHIPAKGLHLIRYYGWYSNKSRGMRKKAEVEASSEDNASAAAATRSSQTWAMLIERVYEVDPLSCPHCGLWHSSTPRAPPEVDGLVLELDAAYSDSSIGTSDHADESQDLTYVDIDTFLTSF